MASTITPDRLKKYPAEARVYVFDFQDFPEVKHHNETLSSPSVPAVSGLTIGAATVTTADFYPGGGHKMVPSGKGVKVTISGGTAGTDYTVVCTVATSGGATLEIVGTLPVVSPT